MPKQTTMMMLGPDAVGKTTLLATMYHEFDNQSDFELTTSGDTHQNLQEAYQKLSSIITQPTFTQTGQLLKGTAGIVEHRFEIQFSGKKELELVFCDIAGGVIRAEKSNNRDFEEFKQKLEEATVIMIVIEAPALIEGNQQPNNPLPVYERLLPTVIDKRNHLILFVITKCEAWLKKEPLKKKLQMAFERQYKKLLQWIADIDNIVGVLIPVKTLGCVEFTRIDYQGKAQEVIFVRKPNLPFKPENTDQPLRYALAFALSQHDQNRLPWNKFVRWLSNQDIAFQKALIEFADARHRHFKIYGNHSLIEEIK